MQYLDLYLVQVNHQWALLCKNVMENASPFYVNSLRGLSPLNAMAFFKDTYVKHASSFQTIDQFKNRSAIFEAMFCTRDQAETNTNFWFHSARCGA